MHHDSDRTLDRLLVNGLLGVDPARDFGGVALQVVRAADAADRQPQRKPSHHRNRVTQIQKTYVTCATKHTKNKGGYSRSASELNSHRTSLHKFRVRNLGGQGLRRLNCECYNVM